MALNKNQTYLDLLKIMNIMTKVRGTSPSYQWNDGEARNYFYSKTNTSYRSLTFSVSEETTYTAKHIRFKLSCCTFNSTGVSFGESCVLDVCFDVAWFMNGIDHHNKKIVLNNIQNDVIQICVDDKYQCINLKDDKFTEEWLFQLMTRYDIPHYEDMLVLKDIRTNMMQYSFPFSFSLTYNNEEDLNMFFDKVYNFLLEQE